MRRRNRSWRGLGCLAWLVITGLVWLVPAGCGGTGQAAVEDSRAGPWSLRTGIRGGAEELTDEEREERTRARVVALETLAERVHFDFDRSDITLEGRRTLDRKVALLHQYPTLRLTIEGHCDEWGSVEYNLVLGQRRAAAVRAYLADQGVSEQRIRTTSYGKERPLLTESDQESWSRNRRAEFLVENPAVLSL